jgi:hypothetical protein
VDVVAAEEDAGAADRTVISDVRVFSRILKLELIT